MGNLESTGGVTSGSITLGQEKMSLTDALRSVVGRVVVIHSNEDDGTQPYGNAGAPMAYGVIALGPADEADNAALAPTVPKVDKIVCNFEAPRGGETGTVVYGDALLTLQEPCDSGGCKARMQARAATFTPPTPPSPPGSHASRALAPRAGWLADGVDAAAVVYIRGARG